MIVRYPGMFIVSWLAFGFLMLEYGIQNTANGVAIVIGIMGLHKILVAYRDKIY